MSTALRPEVTVLSADPPRGSVLQLAWMTARPTRGSIAMSALPVAAFGIVTTLLMIVLGGAQTFWTYADDDAFVYQLLAVVALALLVTPLATLAGSAARLATRRRDDRLATLRLLGASAATVSKVSVVEAGALAGIGALLGWIASAALSPLVGLIHFRGEPLTTAGALLAPPVAVLVVLAVTALAVVSAVVGLRRVNLTPLGVRMRADAPKSTWLVAVLGVIVIGISVVLVSSVSGLGAGVLIVVLGGAFTATLAVLNLVGPWLIRMVARIRLRGAETPAKLLAARGVLESPKDAWRQVSGVAMATFIAVFAGTGVALQDALEQGGSTDPLVHDIRTGVLITVIGAFLMVACSVGVNQAAGILDRRELNVSLDRLGVPVETIDAARRGTVVLPLVVTSIWSAASAAVVVLPLAGIALVVNPLAIGLILAAIGAGIGTVLLSIGLTRPLLRRSIAAGLAS